VRRRGLTWALCGLLGACGPIDGERPHLVLDPAAVYLPGAQEGQSAATPLTLLNLGAATLRIERLDLSSPAFSIEGPQPPVLVEPEEACPLLVRYSPSAGAPAVGTLTITSNDLERSHVPVPLLGPAAEALLTVSPLVIDFGPVASATSATRQVRITNLGRATAHDLALEWIEPNSDFAITPPAPELLPGGTLGLTVSYTPRKGDVDRATLKLRWAGGSQDISLEGQQALKPPR
jgi:hypothetical protein